jgi:hypothetical protein
MYVTETEDSTEISQNVESASGNIINVSLRSFVFYNDLLT